MIKWSGKMKRIIFLFRKHQDFWNVFYCVQLLYCWWKWRWGFNLSKPCGASERVSGASERASGPMFYPIQGWFEQAWVFSDIYQIFSLHLKADPFSSWWWVPPSTERSVIYCRRGKNAHWWFIPVLICWGSARCAHSAHWAHGKEVCLWN